MGRTSGVIFAHTRGNDVDRSDRKLYSVCLYVCCPGLRRTGNEGSCNGSYDLRPLHPNIGIAWWHSAGSPEVPQQWPLGSLFSGTYCIGNLINKRVLHLHSILCDMRYS